jgi:hypothetical protein
MSEPMDEQERQWKAFVAEQHAKGRCEFSGLRATQCQRTICDCFETPEGAAEIEQKAMNHWLLFITTGGERGERMSERLTFSDRVRLCWWKELNRHRRCPECGQRNYGTHAPRWDADPVARMLDAVTPDRCGCCGGLISVETTADHDPRRGKQETEEAGDE